MFHELDGSWPRQEHFHHYLNNVRCTYSLTVQIDITALLQALKSRGLRAYPAQIYLLATVVNDFAEFRMGLSKAGKPGYWESLHPSYTVLNAVTKTFSGIWTPYNQSFDVFYRSCTEDIDRYSHSTEFAPKKDMPPNVFDLSGIPWVDFTAFNLNIFSEGTHLLPIFTIGQYVKRGERTFLPLAMQLHHAACDGYHAGQFIEEVRKMAANCSAWL